MFIYAPRSGSRVIAANEAAACGFIRTVQYTNRSHQVVGGVYLEFTASIPGHYWRHEARKTAEMVVASYGGIAGDDRGTIFMIVPKRAAKTAMAAMAVIRTSTRSGAAVPEPEYENLKNAMACAMAGWDTIPQRNMCSVDWGLPQFILGEFKGKDDPLIGDIVCKRVGDKFSYSIGGEISWTAPWAAIGIEISPEEPCPCECASID